MSALCQTVVGAWVVFNILGKSESCVLIEMVHIKKRVLVEYLKK